MRFPPKGPVVLLLVVVSAYAGVWNAGFVWDDVPLVVQNTELSSLTNLGTFFGGDLWATSGAGDVQSGYYRPLVLLSFAVDRALFGLWAPGYHLHNVGWHLLTVLLVYRLLCRLTSDGPALAGAALFGLHPAQSEVVVWVAARNDPMAAALGLWAILLIADAPRGDRSRWAGAMALACAAAWSKESAYLLPVYLLVIDWGRGKGFHSHRYMALGAGVSVALFVRMLAGVGGAAVPPREGWELLSEVGLSWIGVTTASVIWPWPVSSLRDLHWMDAEPVTHVVAGWVAIVVAAGVAMALRGRARRMFLAGWIWAVGSMLLTLVPIADKGGFGDRFWYLPLVGVSLMLAAACPDGWARRVSVAICVPALIVLQVRVPDWANNQSLWWSAIRDRPTPVNLAGYGHVQFLDERYKRSFVAFTAGLATDRLANDACPRVIASALRMGRPQLATRMGWWAIDRGCPRDGRLNGWLASALAFSGDWSELEAVLHDGPPDPKGRDQVARAVLATVRGDQERLSEIEANWSGAGDMRTQVNRILAKTTQTGDLESVMSGESQR